MLRASFLHAGCFIVGFALVGVWWRDECFIAEGREYFKAFKDETLDILGK
jgi:hypothetical protein